MLSGCSGKSDQTEKTLRVGVITYTQDDPFINGLTDELKEQLKAMENKERRIIVSTKSGNDDQQEQNEKVEEMIDAGCDVLCINLVDRTAPSRIIRMARNEDIPVIFFNREPVREDLMQWEKLYYVGCDAEQSGIMQGEIAAEYINSHSEVDKNKDGKIQYVLLEGEAGRHVDRKFSAVAACRGDGHVPGVDDFHIKLLAFRHVERATAWAVGSEIVHDTVFSRMACAVRAASLIKECRKRLHIASVFFHNVQQELNTRRAAAPQLSAV